MEPWESEILRSSGQPKSSPDDDDQRIHDQMGAMSIAHAPLSEEEDKPEKPHSARVPPIKYILS